MSLSKRKSLAACVFVVLLALVAMPSFEFSACAARAESTSLASAGSFASINEEIDKLVREYYPKAKISVTDRGIHFEYKVKNGISAHSGRPSMVPIVGGILGDVALKEGEYIGADKIKLPSEETDGYNTILTMAPYSKEQNAHLFAQLSFPSDVSVDFMSRFKDAVKAYRTDEAPPSAPKQSILQQSAPQQSAPQQSAPPLPTASVPISKAPPEALTSAWLPVQVAEARLSFKIPASHQEKVVKDHYQSGKFWIGEGEGCKFMVSYLKHKTPCITDADRSKVWNSMVAGMLPQNNPKLVKQFVFQGVKAREYSISDPRGQGKAVLCIAPNCHYIFMAAGSSKDLSGVITTFFNAVKIGK